MHESGAGLKENAMMERKSQCRSESHRGHKSKQSKNQHPFKRQRRFKSQQRFLTSDSAADLF